MTLFLPIDYAAVPGRLLLLYPILFEHLVVFPTVRVLGVAVSFGLLVMLLYIVEFVAYLFVGGILTHRVVFCLRPFVCDPALSE